VTGTRQPTTKQQSRFLVIAAATATAAIAVA
jgi:hypothetical protein